MTHYRFGFVLEQTLGHVTHTRNLEANLSGQPGVEIAWGLVSSEIERWSARVPLSRNWTLRAGLRARQVLAAMHRSGPLDALFFHTQVPAILATDWVRRIPSVISLDGTPWQIDSLGQAYRHGAGPLWVERLKWQLNRDCFGAAQHLVAWSHWAKRGLVADYEVPAEKVTVIPPGVNTADWARPLPRQPHEGPVKILFVGGDLERKGGRVLLEAFRALRPLGVELHLVTRDRVDPEPGLIAYHQMQANSPELRQLYHDSDIFCLPTYGDCLPMVLSEAGAAGLPLVATRVAAIPEVVRDGETGLLVPPGDSLALTAALQRLVVDPDLRTHLGGQAHALVTQQFDAPQNAYRLRDLLQTLVDDLRAANGKQLKPAGVC